MAAIAAGKHVLCEKPLARTAADARRIARAAAKGTGFFMPAMCIRFWPEWAWLKKAIDKGTYGICESCRKPIAKARLKALLFARYCIVCQGSAENAPESSEIAQELRSIAEE